MPTDAPELAVTDRRASFIERVRGSAIVRRLFSGAAWSMAGLVVSRGLLLLAGVAVARLLGVRDYGELGVVQSTIAMFQVLAGMGTGVTATRYVASHRKTDPERAGRIAALSTRAALVSGVVLGLAQLVASPWLAEHALGEATLAPALAIGAIALPFIALNGAQLGVLAGLEAFAVSARANVVTGALSALLLAGGAWFAGVQGSVVGLVAGSAATCLVFRRSVRRELSRAGLKASDAQRSDWRVLWTFSLPSFLASILIAPVNWICTALVVRTPSGLTEMGIYNAANQWFLAAMFIPGLLGQVSLPILSEQSGRGDTRRLRGTLLLVLGASALVVAPVVLAGSAASGLIMSIYGEEFRAHGQTLVVVLVTAGVVAVAAPVGHLLSATERAWTAFLINLAWACTIVPLTAVWAERGADGLALARLVAYLAYGVGSWLVAFLFVARARPQRA